MQQFLVSEIKTHTSANAHRARVCKNEERKADLLSHLEGKKNKLESGEDNYRITAVKMVVWSGVFC